MLTKRYLASTKNLAGIMAKIVEGTAPDKFTVAHLKSIGFSSSTDRAIIPLLKDLGFLTSDGVPTDRYHRYRDPSQSKTIMGEALREAHGDLFHINEHPTKSDRKSIEGKFKSTHNVTDRVAEMQAMTFFALIDLADISGAKKHKRAEKEVETSKEEPSKDLGRRLLSEGGLSLRYNVEIHLPATKDVEVYNAIFKSLKEHLLD